MLFVATFMTTVAGMGWLALSLESHWLQVCGAQAARAGTVRLLRALGALALAASLLICLRADHASMAVLVWVMTLAAGALLIAFALAWRPRVLAPLVWLCAAASPKGLALMGQQALRRTPVSRAKHAAEM